MTGLERLKEIAKSTNDFVISRCIALEMEIAGICDQIEREHLREVDDVSGRDADILAWVEEHGGISELKTMLHDGERAKESVRRQQAHIESIQRTLSDRGKRIQEMQQTLNEALPAKKWVEARGGVEELEKRLMPEGMIWPRFEDGEPLRIWDEFADGLKRTRTCTSVELLGYEEGARDALVHWDGDDPDNALLVCMDSGDRVKRPAPKVLDADGVEIRVGDTVYDMVGDRHEVKGFGKQGDVLLEFHNDESLGWRPSNFTHRAPVLAADGRPLREGETVWGTGREEHEYVILGQPGLGGGAGRFKVACHDVTDDVDCDCDPDLLTHERPVADTWERLEEDAGKEACEYFAHMPCGCESSEMLDETVEKCNAAKARDLVRRAKKLAGVS